MRGEDSPASLFQLGFIIGMDCEQWCPLFNTVTNFEMDLKSHCVIDGITLFCSSCTQNDSSGRARITPTPFLRVLPGARDGPGGPGVCRHLGSTPEVDSCFNRPGRFTDWVVVVVVAL